MPKQLGPVYKDDSDSDYSGKDWSKPNDEWGKEASIQEIEDANAKKAVSKVPKALSATGTKAITDRLQAQRDLRSRRRFSGK